MSKKIKFNWGSGIFVFIVIFFIASFSFIYFSYMQSSDLVDINYYPKEITYQEQIEKIANYENLGDEIKAEANEGVLAISFPDTLVNPISGEIHIYRPSDASLDIKVEINVDQSKQQFILTDQLPSGKYILKIDLECDKVGYYHEMIVII